MSRGYRVNQTIHAVELAISELRKGGRLSKARAKRLRMGVTDIAAHLGGVSVFPTDVISPIMAVSRFVEAQHVRLLKSSKRGPRRRRRPYLLRFIPKCDQYPDAIPLCA
jgi:hypothetical protein